MALRTKVLLGLSIAFVLLVMGRAVPPAFAGFAPNTTEGYLDGSSVFHPASEVPAGDLAADVLLISSNDALCGTSCGNVIFHVYAGGTCQGSSVASDTETVVAGSDVQSAGLSLTPGAYSWQDTWTTPTGPTFISVCEDFVVQGTSVPQFPLGFALVLALAVPALFVLRKRALPFSTLGV